MHGTGSVWEVECAHLVGESVWLDVFLIKVVGTQPICVVGFLRIFNSTLASIGSEWVFKNIGGWVSKMANGEVLTSLDSSGFLVTFVSVPIDTIELVGSSSSLMARSLLNILSQSVVPVRALVVAVIECRFVSGCLCACSGGGVQEVLSFDCLIIKGWWNLLLCAIKSAFLMYSFWQVEQIYLLLLCALLICLLRLDLCAYPLLHCPHKYLILSILE